MVVATCITYMMESGYSDGSRDTKIQYLLYIYVCTADRELEISNLYPATVSFPFNSLPPIVPLNFPQATH